MIERRPFDELGHASLGWLEARHHFAFGDYRDTARIGWGALRVWNDDEIAPGAGFPPHPHADMEIITYVRTGAITHRDSLGHEGRTEAGDVQVMSAGTGIRHAEHNAEAVPATLFQIWITPNQPGGSPAWGARPFPRGERAGRWVTLASGYGEAGVLPIRADARVLGATLRAGESLTWAGRAGGHAYLVAATGQVDLNGVVIDARDGAAIHDETALTITALHDTEFVLVETA